MYEMNTVDELKNKGYPYYFKDHDYGGSTIFFQNEAMRDKYIKEITNVDLRNEIFITGKFLGYPPIACQFFSNANSDEELSNKRAGFRYQGYQFAGNIDDTEEIVAWLWENVPAPLAEVEIEYNNEIRVIEPAIVT
jgi:hypothetical protein